jgi:hypothetical protein
VVDPELTGGADDVHPAGFAKQVQQDPPPLFGCERSGEAHRSRSSTRSARPYLDLNVPGLEVRLAIVSSVTLS